MHSELKQQQAKLAKASKKDKKASLQESARLHEKELNALQSQVDQLGRDAEVVPFAAVSCDILFCCSPVTLLITIGDIHTSTTHSWHHLIHQVT